MSLISRDLTIRVGPLGTWNVGTTLDANTFLTSLFVDANKFNAIKEVLLDMVIHLLNLLTDYSLSIHLPECQTESLSYLHQTAQYIRVVFPYFREMNH